MKYCRSWMTLVTVSGCLSLVACATSQTKVGSTAKAVPGSDDTEIYRISQLQLPMPEAPGSAGLTRTKQAVDLVLHADGQSRLTVRSESTESFLGCPQKSLGKRSFACHENPPPPKTTQKTYQLNGTAQKGERLVIKLEHGQDPDCRTRDAAGRSSPCPIQTLELTCEKSPNMVCQIKGQWPGDISGAMSKVVFTRHP